MVPQLHTRQALLLTLLDAFSGKVGNLDFYNFRLPDMERNKLMLSG